MFYSVTYVWYADQVLRKDEIDATINIVTCLLKNGVDVNAVTYKDKTTALHMAASTGDLSVVYALCALNETNLDVSSSILLKLSLIQNNSALLVSL